MMNILIAPNSFKECSNSNAITDIINNNLKKSLNCNLIRKPISDGGDGFADVCKHYFNGEELIYIVSTANNDGAHECKVIYSEETKTIYIESANVFGLKVVPPEKRNPLLLSSKGLGELLVILECEKFDIRKVVIGIGGTATIDMGLGACSALGLKLINVDGEVVDVIPLNYGKVGEIVWNEYLLPFSVINIIDVFNPLIGKQGAAKQFGAQKGASIASIESIENGFDNILNIIQNKGLLDSSKVLYGAGGGISAGLSIFLETSEIYAEEFIMKELNVSEEIKKSDWVITGEGAFDQQSFLGKGAGIIVNKALEYGKRVILVCGKYDENVKSKLNENVHVFEIASLFNNQEESINNFEKGLNEICNKIVALIKYGVL